MKGDTAREGNAGESAKRTKSMRRMLVHLPSNERVFVMDCVTVMLAFGFDA